MQLRFDAAHAPGLPQDVRARLIRLAGRRASRDGMITITAQRHRTRRDAACLEQGLNLVGGGRGDPRVRNIGGHVDADRTGSLVNPIAGETDDIGWKSVEKLVTWPDFHATVLHLLGIDHTRLTFYHNGIQRRLTNVHGEVVRGILA